MADGLTLIARERERQKTVEGFTPDHDDEHDAGDLAAAAQSYEEANPDEWNKPPRSYQSKPAGFPWAAKWWKPKDRLSNLVRAGALYQAEIDRLQRCVNRVAREIDQMQ